MGKNKKKKKREEPVFVNALSPAPKGLTAVFEDDDDGYENFPVVLFAVVDLGSDKDGQDIRGLISADGGLFSPEDDEAFVGYWFKGVQEIAEFLQDHGRDTD